MRPGGFPLEIQTSLDAFWLVENFIEIPSFAKWTGFYPYGQFYCYDCWEAWDAQSTEASETLGLKGKLDESEELGEKSLKSVHCDVKIGPKSTFWAGLRGWRPSWNGLEVIQDSRLECSSAEKQRRS